MKKPRENVTYTEAQYFLAVRFLCVIALLGMVSEFGLGFILGRM